MNHCLLPGISHEPLYTEGGLAPHSQRLEQGGAVELKTGSWISWDHEVAKLLIIGIIKRDYLTQEPFITAQSSWWIGWTRHRGHCSGLYPTWTLRRFGTDLSDVKENIQTTLNIDIMFGRGHSSSWSRNWFWNNYQVVPYSPSRWTMELIKKSGSRWMSMLKEDHTPEQANKSLNRVRGHCWWGYY